jgi:DNA-binding beta-propeller fold protein YncE
MRLTLPKLFVSLLVVATVACPSLAAEKLVLVAGGGTGGDGSPAKEAKLNAPFGVEFDQDGNLYLVEMYANKFRLIDKAGKVRTLAGTAEKGKTDGPAAMATLNGPHSLAIGPNGKVYIADTWNHCVREYDPAAKTITTVIGTGEKGFSGDGGSGDKATFNELYDALWDKQGKLLYLVDLKNSRIRTWDPETKIVKTVAGNGQKGTPKDGAVATEAPLNDPRAVAIDGAGNFYILERGGNSLRVVDGSTGTIKTVAGTGKKGPLTADGPALKATLNGPKFLWCDRDDNILIADSDNHCIRKYTAADGMLTLVAGTGKPGSAGLDGPPKEAQLNQPHGIYEAPDGTLYISDSSNHRVLKIVKD